MAGKGDITTLGIGGGGGITDNNGVLSLTLNQQILAYLGTTSERLASGKDKIVLKFDYSDKHKRAFIGFGLFKID